MKPSKGEFVPLKGKGAYASILVKLGDDKGSCQVIACDKKLYSVYLTNKGKVKGKAVLHYKHNNYLYNLTAAAVPGTNFVFVIMKTWTSDTSFSLEGLVIEGK
jgi:hypothetical protein